MGVSRQLLARIFISQRPLPGPESSCPPCALCPGWHQQNLQWVRGMSNCLRPTRCPMENRSRGERLLCSLLPPDPTVFTECPGEMQPPRCFPSSVAPIAPETMLCPQFHLCHFPLPGQASLAHPLQPSYSTAALGLKESQGLAASGLPWYPCGFGHCCLSSCSSPQTLPGPERSGRGQGLHSWP